MWLPCRVIVCAVCDKLCIYVIIHTCGLQICALRTHISCNHELIHPCHHLHFAHVNTSALDTRSCEDGSRRASACFRHAHRQHATRHRHLLTQLFTARIGTYALLSPIVMPLERHEPDIHSTPAAPHLQPDERAHAAFPVKLWLDERQVEGEGTLFVTTKYVSLYPCLCFAYHASAHIPHAPPCLHNV